MANKLTDDQKANIVKFLVTDAEDYIDSSIAPQRELATRYYNGEAFGNEEAGRSQIVMTEVRDVVQAMMPSLLRVFLSTENVVEYAPRRADSVEMAEQATDYVNYVFFCDNDGDSILYSAFMDALVRKTGIVRWHVDTREYVTEEHYEGIDDDTLTMLENTEGLELTDLNELLPAGFDDVDPMTGEPVPAPAIFNATFKRTVVHKRFVVEAVPPEEFIISRNARSEDDAGIIGLRRDMLVSDLVAMGFDQDEIMEHGKPQSVLELNQESTARNPALRNRADEGADKLDPSMSRVRYYDVLVRMDSDGDGVAELHRISAIGEHGSYILDDQIVSDVNYAIFCPSPEPHTAIGHSMADLIMDLQLIKSSVVRNTLDSLAQSIHPRTGVVEGQVNMDDVLNTEIGGIVRMRQAGAVQPLAQPFVGQQSLPIISYLDEIRSQRTGITRASQGLDPDVLQSTTKAAVTATVSAAQERLEMTARLFANGGMRRLFRGLLKMLVQNQERGRMVRLRGKWVDVNPAAWDADMDVIVNVGLGLGDRAEKVAVLTQVSLQQKETLTTLGTDNPLVDIGQYRSTLGKLLELTGFKDTATYWKEITPEAVEAFKQQLAQKQKPDPAQILAQVEADKTKADIAINRAKLMLEERKIKMQDDRERDRNEAEAWLRAAEIQARYGAQVDMANMKAMMDRQRMLVETALTVAANEAEIAGQQEAQAQPQPQPQPQAPV